MRYLLDTSICVFFLRGKLDLDEVIKEKGLKNFFVSEMTVAELRFGAEKSNDALKSHAAVDAFLENLFIVPIFDSINLYAKEKARLRSLGKPMNDEFDLFIGATAIYNNFVLVTDNVKHFELLDGIQIENWYAGKR